VRIRLSEERRADLVARIQAHLRAQAGEDVGPLKAELLLDFFVKELGPPVYNQAIRDAHDFLAEKLVDLEGEFYEPDEPSR
jgi:uncharacterized protein (DUF2164 family)